MLKKVKTPTSVDWSAQTNDQLAKAIGRKLHETASLALSQARDRLADIQQAGQDPAVFGGNVHDVMAKALAHCTQLGGDGNWGDQDAPAPDDNQSTDDILAAILGGDGDNGIGDDVDEGPVYDDLFGDDSDDDDL